MKLSLLSASALLLLLTGTAQAQTGNVGIGTTSPNAKAALDISATDKGLLLPRLTQAQRLALSASAGATPPGLTVFQTGPDSVGVWAYSGLRWLWLNGSGGGGTPPDNLGNHTATQALDLGANPLRGSYVAAPTTGLTLAPDGRVNMTATGGGWIGSSVGNAAGDRVVSGNLYGRATLGGHTSDLGAWVPLYLNPSGNVVVGGVPASQKLTVEGQVYSTTGGFRFPDGTVQTTAAAGGSTQTLSVSGQSLSISGGNTVTLPAATQTLSVSGQSLSISGGNSVTLPAAPGDNLGNHTATQNLSLDTNALMGNYTGIAPVVGLTATADGRLNVSTATGGNWIGMNIGSNNNGDRVVSGLLGGRATLGAHNGSLSAWSNLYLSPVGNVGVGSVVASQKLTVEGQVFSTTGGFRFPDGTVQTTAAAAAVADNLGNHTATQPLNLGAQRLVGTSPGTTAPGLSVGADGLTRINSTNPGSGGANWIATSIGGAAGDRLVAGLLGGRVTLGAHTAALDAWADLVLNPDGNVGIGTFTPGAKLHVAGTGASSAYVPVAIAGATARSADPLTPVANASDNDLNTFWGGVYSQGTPQWLRYTLAQATVVTRYIVSVPGGIGSASAWRLEASNDPNFGSGAFVVLHTATPPVGNSGTYTTDFANATAYLYYRLWVNGAVSPGNGNALVAEFALARLVNTPSSLALRVAPGALQLENGAAVREFSTDGTLAANADDVVPTQRAIRTYVAANATPADNLGNHTATQNLALGNNRLTGTATSSAAVGLSVAADGQTRFSTTNPGFGVGNWIAANAGAAAGGDRVVMGLCNGKATIGGHDNILANWTDLILSPVPSVGNVGIGTSSPTEKLHVVGNIVATGSINSFSDRRYKERFAPLPNALQNVLQLNGLTYYWRRAEFPEENFGAARQLGFIAQDIEKFYPEMVATDAAGYKSVDYSRLTPVLVEAIKELNAKLETANTRAAAAEAALGSFEARLRALEAPRPSLRALEIGEAK